MRPAKSSVVHFLSRVGVSVVGFFGTLYLTRTLGAGRYGTYIVVLSLVYWLSIPSNAISGGITKRLSESDQKGSYLGAGLLLTGGSIAVVTLGLALFHEQVVRYTGVSELTLILFVAVVHLAVPAVTGGLSGQFKVSYAGLLVFVEHALRVGLQVVLLTLGWGLAGALFGYGVASVLVVVFGFALYDVRPQLPTKEEIRNIVDYVRYSWLGSIKAQVAGSAVDVILLKFFVGTSLIAIYQVSWNLAGILVMVAGSIQAAIFPEVSQLAERGEFEQVREMLEDGLVFSGLFAFPGLLGAALIGERVLRIYGGEFDTGVGILLILIVARMVSSFGSQFVGVINGVDRPDVAFRVNLVLIVSNIGLNALLIPLIGWFGAAIGTAVAAATTLVLGYYYLTDLVGRVQLPYGEFGKQLVASGVMAVVVFAIQSVVPPYSHYATAALVLVGAAVYSTVVLLLSTRIREKMRVVVPVGL